MSCRRVRRRSRDHRPPRDSRHARVAGRFSRWPHNNEVTQRHATHNNDPMPKLDPARAARTLGRWRML